MIASVAQRLGFDECDCGQIALALDEALCNVINHGYRRNPSGRIWISVWPIDQADRCAGVRILIEDEGEQVDPESIRSRSLEEIRPGGLGVFIMKEIMDRVEYERRARSGMALLLEKRLNYGRESTASAVDSSSRESCCRKAVDGDDRRGAC